MVRRYTIKKIAEASILILIASCFSGLLVAGNAAGGAWEQAVGMSGGVYGNVPDVPNPECVEGCDFEDPDDDDSDSRSPSHHTPSGPSPEEKERTRVNAMNYANEKGIKCFKQGDWNCAVRSFEKALQYSPYNPTLVKNLNRAREEALREQAGHGFDTPGSQSASVPRPAPAYNPFQTYKEPVITSANRTPAIAKLENIKATLKKKRNDTETRITELQKDPHKNQQEITTVKKEISELKDQENFLNFSITVELKKAPDVQNNSRR